MLYNFFNNVTNGNYNVFFTSRRYFQEPLKIKWHFYCFCFAQAFVLCSILLSSVKPFELKNDFFRMLALTDGENWISNCDKDAKVNTEWNKMKAAKDGNDLIKIISFKIFLAELQERASWRKCNFLSFDDIILCLIEFICKCDHLAFEETSMKLVFHRNVCSKKFHSPYRKCTDTLTLQIDRQIFQDQRELKIKFSLNFNKLNAVVMQ